MPAQQRLDQIRDLVNQWEQLVGYSIEVPDWAISEMADHPDHYLTLYNIGQYMSFHVDAGGAPAGAAFVPDIYRNMPWAQWGMTVNEYDSKISAYEAAFRTLTGQGVSQELVNRALNEHMGTMTGQQFETWLLASNEIKNTYGWLKYGLDYNQFQTRKLEMRTQFGVDLTDQEAVTQLQYLHAAQGPNVGAAAQPTLSQAEKKQVQTGISGSVVR